MLKKQKDRFPTGLLSDPGTQHAIRLPQPLTLASNLVDLHQRPLPPFLKVNLKPVKMSLVRHDHDLRSAATHRHHAAQRSRRARRPPLQRRRWGFRDLQPREVARGLPHLRHGGGKERADRGGDAGAHVLGRPSDHAHQGAVVFSQRTRRRPPAVAGGSLKIELGIATWACAPFSFAGWGRSQVAVAIVAHLGGYAELEYVYGVGGRGDT